MPLPLEKKFIPESCFALLSVEKPAISERIYKVAKERGFGEKPEFHISIMVTKNARKVREIISKSENSEKLKEEIAEHFNSFVWSYSLADDYFLQEHFYTRKELDEADHADLPEHTRRTIIQKVEMSDIVLFYESLSDKLGISFDIPIPHITLFSWSDYPPLMMRGIGISSEEDFKKYSRGKIVIKTRSY